MLALLVLAGCGAVSTTSIHYHPPFTPIDISVDSSGKWSVSAEAELVTPLGVFNAEAGLEPPSDDSTTLVLVHAEGGRPVQSRYRIDTAEPLGACLDGQMYGRFEPHRIVLTARSSATRIKIVRGSDTMTACSAPAPAATPQAVGSRNGHSVVRVAVGGTTLAVALSVAAQDITDGMSGWAPADLVGLDGMLYVLPAPQTFDPATGENGFIFPGYTFRTDVHFFDTNGGYLAGGPVEVCPRGGPCTAYFAERFGVPIPYRYVLELVAGRLPSTVPGTPLRA